MSQSTRHSEPAASAGGGLPRLGAGESIAPGYTIIALLHRGVDLDTYDVWSEERGCRCVAKVPRPDRLANRSVRLHLLREGHTLRRLTHPHIVRAYDVQARPSPVVILETLTGETLAHLLAGSRRPSPLVTVAHLGLHLCAALHYLHGHNILHLDLKPANIVAERGVAKVLDLSLARRPGRGPRCYGTDAYMAPEQARGGIVQPGHRRVGTRHGALRDARRTAAFRRPGRGIALSSTR